MPEEKSPDEAVANADEEDCHDPRTVAYVQVHSQNGQQVVILVLLSCHIISAAILSTASCFIIRVCTLCLQMSHQHLRLAALTNIKNNGVD